MQRIATDCNGHTYIVVWASRAPNGRPFQIELVVEPERLAVHDRDCYQHVPDLDRSASVRMGAGKKRGKEDGRKSGICLLYTSPSPRDRG
eukprot:707495-Rhodomonas_salina.1